MKEYSIHYYFLNHKVGLLLMYFNILFSKKKYFTETATSREQKNKFGIRQETVCIGRQLFFCRIRLKN